MYAKLVQQWRGKMLVYTIKREQQITSHKTNPIQIASDIHQTYLFIHKSIKARDILECYTRVRIHASLHCSRYLMQGTGRLTAFDSAFLPIKIMFLYRVILNGRKIGCLVCIR